MIDKHQAETLRTKPLDDKEFEVLKYRFYKFAQNYGFYLKMEDAKKNNGMLIYPFQKKIAHHILQSMFQQKIKRLNISVLRQVGKTEFVSLAVGFCFRHFKEVFGRPIDICVVSPDKRTSKKVFDTIIKYIDSENLARGGDTREYKKSTRGDQIDLFGIYDEYKGGTIEGRTYDLVVRDECHKGNDRKFIDEVEPTVSSRNNCVVFVGNGGWSKCLFMRRIEAGNYIETIDVAEGITNTVENVLIRHTYEEFKPYLQQLAKAGIDSSIARITNIESTIREHGGEDSWEILKNYFCKWITKIGNYVTPEQLEACYAEVKWKKSEPTPLYMGIDFARVGDRTVATIMTANREIIDWVVLKEADEDARLRQQCEDLRDYCDLKKYTPHICAIGADATGLGIGAVEFLQTEFGYSEIEKYTFSDKTKHEWYSKGREMIATRYTEDRIKYDPNHKYAKIFEKEMTELEVDALEKKKQYMSFRAPSGQGHYDDFVASYVIVNDLRLRDRGMYENLKTYKQRTRQDDDDDAEMGPEEGRFDFFKKYSSSF